MADVTNAELLVVLERISAQLEALPKAIASAGHRGSSLTRADRQCLASLLPAISRAVGNAVFTTRDLQDQAGADPDLAQALVTASGALDSSSGRKLGKLLARADGFAEGDLRITSVRKVREGTLWRVERV